MSGSPRGQQERTLSRVGRRPVPIPAGVKVTVADGALTVEGPKGTLSQPLHPEVIVRVEDGSVVVERTSPRKFHHALHGLYRSLIANAITGVTQEYQKSLELSGVGYRVQSSGDGIVLTVGLTHSVEIHPLAGVILTVEGNNRIHVRGIDKQKVGAVAAQIRRVRPPDPYKGKGIRFAGEVLRLKPGKAGRKAV